MKIDPDDHLTHLLSGDWHTQAISVSSRLDIATLLKDDPRSAEDLAQATAMLTSLSIACCVPWQRLLGIFAEDDQRRFMMTPLAECLLNHATKAMNEGQISLPSIHHFSLAANR